MRCLKCESKFGYVRIKAKEWICRNCGETSPINELKSKLKNFAGI